MVYSTQQFHQNRSGRSFQKMPKVELHRHFEGSLPIAYLLEIIKEYKLDIQVNSLKELRPLLQVESDYPNFQNFLSKFLTIRKFFVSEEVIRKLAYLVVADCADDNIKYLELRFNPVALASQQKCNFSHVVDYMIESVNKAQQDYDIKVNLIVQMGRHEPQHAEELAAIAVAYKDKGVVALDLAGDEENINADRFIGIMKEAKQHGLFLTAHAGEVKKCHKDCVDEVINVIGVDRIGHGTQAQYLPGAVELIKEKNVFLEMCVTSNHQTGAIANDQLHPLVQYHRMGLPVTINTDDPLISDITLSYEYWRVMSELGATLDELKQIVRTGVDAAFLTSVDKQKLLDKIQGDLSNFSFP